MSEQGGESRAPARADGYNAGYAEQLYERRLRERGLIPPSLAEWVENGAPAGVAGVPAAEAPAPVPADRLRSAARAAALVEAYRELGHFAARLDPLGSDPGGHPMLKPAFHGIGQQDLEEIPAEALGLERLGRTAAEVIERLREIYCGPIGYELGHVENPAERDWLVDYIESGRHRVELSAEQSAGLLDRLTQVEGLERFLQRAYLGKKRFSIEGLDMMVPMLDEALRRAAASGTREMLLGMSHRGRLNVLAHIIGRSYEAIIAEFEDQAGEGVARLVPADGTGDVKYHLGAAGVAHTEAGDLDVYMAPNPSHLEHVDPVVEGMARAARDLRRRGERGSEETRALDAREDAQPVLPILIHGDAAFMGEGVAAETLNLCRLPGYETGGTLHIIADNQLGFTTDPRDGRSTRYASDIAIGFRIPVVHVNADHPEACLAAARLAFEYRREFGQDMMIDLVGYRRHGHNEGDEPGYTQPAMYRAIDDHPTVRALWAARLAEDGIVSDEEASAMEDRVAERLQAARERVQQRAESGDARGGGPGEGADPPGSTGRPSAAERALRTGLTELDDPAEVDTAVPEERLQELDRGLHAWPEDFELFQKLGRQLDRRRKALAEGEPLDWAHAEALAFATLVTGGVAVRLSGEDTERGTFSQRHLVLHAADGSRTWVPLEHLSGDQATFEVWNSPLSEVAALGFEYGYSTIATDGLALWEAQFGDFANVGQAIIDQFIAAGRSKWGQESRLGLLLPHAYEGQGPEHSSARLERYLQLAGRGNIRVTYPTTPAQYFHLLRLQALRPARRPLVVMTPKSLLRHPRARSPLAEFSGGGFRALLGEPLDGGARDGGPGAAPAGVPGGGPGAAAASGRLVLCSGKVYYDLFESDARREAADRDGAPTPILRVEELYPFPEAAMRQALEAREGLREVVWAQEEPENMGAWTFVRPRLEALLPEGAALRYVGRPEMASPAEGYHAAHQRDQHRIVRAAFGLEAGDAG